MRPLVALVAFALAAVSGGCGSDRACFTWGMHEGACPSRQEAKAFMTPQNTCQQEVVQSVDSDGELEQDDTLGTAICCYDVTKGTGSCGP